MRKRLAEYDDGGTFTAIIAAFGRDTVLLDDVRDDLSRVVADHLWVDRDELPWRTDLFDYVRFDAYAREYRRSNGSIDWGLVGFENVRKLKDLQRYRERQKKKSLAAYGVSAASR